jgi:AraC-like DNA-binding protein
MEPYNNAVEQELLSCVEYGKVDLLKSILDKMSPHSEPVPEVAPDTVRVFKNIFIFSAGIASRATVKGSLSYDVATAVADYYLKHVERLDRYIAIHRLFNQMLLDFTRKTARARSGEASTMLVRRIRGEALSHLNDSISTANIAQRLGLSRSYLCRHFKGETGKTISAYINEVKITESKRLLETTETSIADIAEELAFSSQAYFQRVFKRVTGLSPAAYRNSTH